MDWNEITKFEGPEQSPGFLLWQISISWRRQIETALATLELTHPQFVLLASVGWLTRNRNDVTQIEIAHFCQTDITMTSQVLRTLEKKGYIIRKRLNGDERAKFPYLTPKGQKLIQKAIPLVKTVDKNYFEKLGNDLHKFIKILQKLT